MAPRLGGRVGLRGLGLQLLLLPGSSDSCEHGAHRAVGVVQRVPLTGARNPTAPRTLRSHVNVMGVLVTGGKRGDSAVGQHGQRGVDVSRGEIRTAVSFVALEEVRSPPSREAQAHHLVIPWVRGD